MTNDQLKKRIELMSNRKLIYSNQYGMVFILNEQGEILLNITALAEESPKRLRKLFSK